MTDAFEARTRALQRALRADDGDVVVVGPGPNLYYLSGFATEPWDRHFLLFVPAEGEPRFVVPAMFEGQLREGSWIPDVDTFADTDDPRAVIERVGRQLGFDSGTILVDDQLWARYAHDLRSVFDDATFGLSGELVERLRLTKDDVELDAIERASEIADSVSEEVRSLDAADVVGRTERALAREIETRLYDRGGEDLPFDVVASSGPNTAHVFHHHGDREIEPGDPILLDFGCYVDQYCSDQTRMVVYGDDPPSEFERAFTAVREAMEAGVDAVEPGIAAEAVEHACHAVLEAYDLVERTLHRTGHGVGLSPHEGPNVLDGDRTTLEPGMVFSVEPGVYFEGEFGVRVEDLVAVTEDGYRRLNSSPQGWQPL